MAIDFSDLQGTPAQPDHVDFSDLGAIPALHQDTPAEEETTSLGAAGRGAVGMIPLGEQAYSAVSGVVNKKPYLASREELEKQIEADKLNHLLARTAGQAAGIAAPALLTGGASAPATLAEAAGEGALVGGGFGVGNAIDTLASGGSGAQAAGDVALGTALGAGGGTLGKKIAGIAEEAVPGIEKFAAKKAAQGVGLGSGELGHMTEEELVNTGKTLMAKGIVKQGASTQEMFDTAKALRETAGERIGQIGKQAKELGLTTDVKPILSALEEKFKAADALANPDERKAAVFYKRGMADILTMARQNMPETLADVHGAPVPNDITFDQLQRLKKSYGNSAFENGMVKNSAAADVYSQLSKGQKSIVERIRDNPSLPAELKDAMHDYSTLHPVVEGLQDVLGRERAGNMPAKGFGMVGKLVGQLPGQNKPAINALTSLGLMGAGHPMWAIGAATATLQNPRAMSNLAQGTARAIPEVAEKLPTVFSQMSGLEVPHGVNHFTEHAVEHGVHHTTEHAIQQNMGETKPLHGEMAAAASPEKTPATAVNISHPALAPWKHMFDKNAAHAKDEGERKKSQAVTDFILSQRDPLYVAAKQKASDEPISEASQSPAKMAEGGAVPARSTQKPKEQFNSDMADKLKEFLAKQKEQQNAESR